MQQDAIAEQSLEEINDILSDHLISLSFRKLFPDETKVLEINSIENLIALCPTHHWEFDNGLLV